MGIAASGQAEARPYADQGKPEQCGTYAEASYDRDSYFPGGESGVLSLTDPKDIRGLNALLFDAILSEEGANEPTGRVLAIRAPLLGANGQVLAAEVVAIITEDGIRLLQPCP